MKANYKNLGGTNMKIVADNYRSAGSVEPKKKPEDWHYSKLVKTKTKQGATGGGYNHRDVHRDAGTQNILNCRLYFLNSKYSS